jgi:4-hydroxyphenylpyruvate dioxygenase
VAMDFKLCMNSMTFSLESVDFSSMVEAIAGTGFAGIELRDSHIEQFMAKGYSTEDIKVLLEARQLRLVAVHALRDWQRLGRENEKKDREFVEQFIAKSRAIGCHCVACPAYAEDSDTDRDIRHFREICEIGRAYDTQLAIEFLPWAALKDVRKAWEVVQQAECPNGGILIDAFHFFKGGSRVEDLRQIPAEKIFVVHLDDAPDVVMDLREMCMTSRTFPGEGIFPLTDLLDVLIRERGYKGWFSLEVLNKGNEERSYSEIAKKGVRSLEELFRPYET